MAYDENVYPDPNDFNPERFMGENQQQDPNDFIFGFGRRICPGKSVSHFCYQKSSVRW
jgi:cytochrome P450